MGEKSAFYCRVMIDMTNELISEWPKVQNGIFLFFLFCFLTSVFVFSIQRKLIVSLYHDFSKTDERKGMFADTSENKSFGKIFLIIQTAGLLSIAAYCILLNLSIIRFDTSINTFIFLLKIMVGFLSFFIIKSIINSIFGYIFFDKGQVRLWSSTYFSLLSLTGLLLFVPILFLFYLEKTYVFFLVLILFILVFVVFLTIYKIYKIFFSQKNFLLYFILYLCTLEIMPLFLTIQVFIYFISKQKGYI